MAVLLPVFAAGAYLILVSDQMPKLDTDASCRASAAVASAINRNEDNCRKDEQDARAKLDQQWKQFSAAEQTRCVALSKLGGFPSYVELLTCLEMAAQAKTLPPAAKPAGMAK